MKKILYYKIKFSTIVLWLLFFIIGINRETNFCYVLFGLLISLTFFHILVKGHVGLKSKFFFGDGIPFIFLLCWLYGIILGIKNGNKPEYIALNNAGMVMYSVYYALIHFRISRERIFKIMIAASLSVAIITIVFYLLSIFFDYYNEGFLDIVLGSFLSGSSTGQARVYFVGQICLFTSVAVYLGRVFATKQQRLSYFQKADFITSLKDILILSFFLMVTVFFTASKGFMLGFLFLFFVIPFSLFFRGISKGKVNIRIILFLLLILLILILLLSLGYFNLITALFDSNDEANFLRYEQLVYLINDLTFFGKGLGAVIPGYERNFDKPYGFELSYLNLIHKFGILSLLMMVLYLATIIKAMGQIIRGVNVKYALASLGAMGYLFPAMGNPIIFAPQAVVLHCMAIYLLYQQIESQQVEVFERRFLESTAEYKILV